MLPSAAGSRPSISASHRPSRFATSPRGRAPARRSSGRSRRPDPPASCSRRPALDVVGRTALRQHRNPAVAGGARSAPQRRLRPRHPRASARRAPSAFEAAADSTPESRTRKPMPTSTARSKSVTHSIASGPARSALGSGLPPGSWAEGSGRPAARGDRFPTATRPRTTANPIKTSRSGAARH